MNWFNRNIFLQYLLEIGIEKVDTDKFYKFGELLIEWNKKFNLTRVPPEEFQSRHFIDSLLLLPYLKPHKILDIGSGAGFPGIPLAIVSPELDFTLIDSLLKRVRFLEEVINSLDLKNVTAVHSRVEDFIGEFDTVVSRALSPMKNLINLTRHLLKNDGIGLAIKGPKILEEKEAKKIVEPKVPRDFPIKSYIVIY